MLGPRRSVRPHGGTVRELFPRERGIVGKRPQGIVGGGSARCQREIRESQAQTPPLTEAPPLRCRRERPADRRCPPLPNPESRDLPEELRAASQWLQSLELLLAEPTPLRSPEPIRRDLRHVTSLQRELKSRSLILTPPRSATCRNPEETPAEIRELEERFRMVQEALRRRVSDLRDSLVLSEFMKVVQKEAELRQKGEAQEDTEAPGETPDAPEGTGRQEASPSLNELQEATFPPLQELQEAVEMLNDVEKEREQRLAAERQSAELERRLPMISEKIGSISSRLQSLQVRIEAAEAGIRTAKVPAEVTDLQEISGLMQQLEAEVSGEMRAEVLKLEETLRVLGPLRVATHQMEEALQDWRRLEEDVQRSQRRLSRTSTLRDFRRTYLGMISWTEETGAQILSDNPEERLSAEWRERLESGINLKMREFEELAGIGWTLIREDRTLTHTIREHLEELQGMLSWVLMRWRCQKHPRMMGNATHQVGKTEKPRPWEEFECPEDEERAPPPLPQRGPRRRQYRRGALSPVLFQPPALRVCQGAELQEGGPSKVSRGPLWLEPKVLPTPEVIQEPEEAEPTMVSSYLNATEKVMPETCQSLTVPRPAKKSPPPNQCTFLEDRSAKSRPSSLFGSLKRKEKVQRSTVQGIMGVCSSTKDTIKYETSTWPRKLDRRSPKTDLKKMFNYVQNPLTKDIDDECGDSPPEVDRSNSDQAQPSCPRMTIGSVLTLKLSKEAGLQENITNSLRIVSANGTGSPPFSDSGGTNEPISVGPPKGGMVSEEADSAAREFSSRSWIAALTSSPGYCRQNIHGYWISSDLQPQNLEEINDDFVDFELDRLSPIGILPHLEPERETQKPSLIKIADTQKITCEYQVMGVNGLRQASTSSISQISSCDVPLDPSKYESSYVEFLRPYNEKPPMMISSEGAFRPSSHPPEKRTASHSFPEVLHPDQEFLEHDDEELEDIWNKAKRGRLGSPQKKPHVVHVIGGDLLYPIKKGVLCAPDHTTPCAPDHTAPCAPDYTALSAPDYTALSAPDHTALCAPDYTTLIAPDHTALCAPDHTALVSPNHTGLISPNHTALFDPRIPDSEPKALVASFTLPLSAVPSTEPRKKDQENVPDKDQDKCLVSSSMVANYNLGQLPHTIDNPGQLPDTNYYTGKLPDTNYNSGYLQDTNYKLGQPDKNNIPGQLPDTNHYTGTLPDTNYNSGQLPDTNYSPGQLPDTNYNPGKLTDTKYNTGKLPDTKYNTGKLLDTKCNTGKLPDTTNYVSGQLQDTNYNSGQLKDGNYNSGQLPDTNYTSMTDYYPGQHKDTSYNSGHLQDPKYSPGQQPGAFPPDLKSETPGPRKLDFHLMEGTLERKHVLQPGGKKASCRAWGIVYAVLVRRTLSFYHDHKQPTKSLASAPPLHLTGALCCPEPHYTKRDNCFCLRLLDGSEYLFRAPSASLLQEWVSKLRHNSGLEDGDLLGDGPPAERSPRLTSRVTRSPLVVGEGCQAMAAGCREKPTFVRRADARRVTPGTDDWEAASRRRSCSFSSVTYQKIVSAPGQREAPPSFSVSLYLEEPLSPRPRCYSLTPPSGKAVLRKLFWKKEGAGFRV